MPLKGVSCLCSKFEYTEKDQCRKKAWADIHKGRSSGNLQRVFQRREGPVFVIELVGHYHNKNPDKKYKSEKG
jgi:hypothetical protein